MLNVSDAEGAKNDWHGYMKDGGIFCSLTSHGVSSEEDPAKIMEFGFNPARMRNNPRIVNADWVKRMMGRLINEDLS